MFYISWGKLVIIGVVALIFIGPKELPTVLRTLGQWMTKIRRMAAEFQGQFQDAMRDAEMADLKKTFDKTTSSLNSVFDPSGFKTDMEKMINDPMGTSAATPPSDPTVPASAEPAPAEGATPPSDPAAPGTAQESSVSSAPPAVDVSVPMPELPPPVETKDFAAAAPEPAHAPEAGGGKAA